MAMSVQKPPHPSQMDPRLRRAVYAKYREMLVSKNSQANEMIKQLPAYMVREDRGFNTTNVIVNDVPPPPPPCPGKNLPAQRLQTQISEAPACVQNAMMTKDKKPFTYTPGGIDLSQIKSPRMAKRISMNANSPGVSNTPKVSPLAQISNGNSTPVTPSPQVVPTPPPAPPMGQFAMGMPFQVLPPPPPPPPMKMEQPQKLSPPQTNGNSARKSPQAFEPPPMGCRPEIKIPENPMASLRKVPKPQQKDTFWVEEFIRDQTRNSPPQQSPQIQHPMSPQVQQQREYVPSPPIQQHQQQQREFVPTPPITPKPSTPVQQFLPQRRSPSPERPEIRNIKLEDVRSASPTRVQVNRSSPVVSSSPVTVAKNVTMEPIQPSRPQNYQQPPAQGGKIILSTMPNRSQQAQQNLGSLYIPPPMTSFDDKQYLLSQQSPPWMSTKQISLDTPEWVNRDELDNFIQQTRMMHAQPKEHVVPISVEKTPTTPSTMPNYGPTPFYGTPQQHINSIIQPRVDPNANKFVNQGYGEYQYPKTPQQPQQQRQQSQAGTRIIPIQVEAARASPNDNTTTVVMKSDSGKYQYTIHDVPLDAALRFRSGHLSDPRQPPSPRVNAFGAPSQSRSFKILQQVTNTLGDDSDDNNSESKQMLDDTPMQEQRPIFSRPLEAKDMNETQMRRLQLSENDRAFMNRVKQQVDDEIYLHSESDPRYKGSAIPSKAFKALQTMTDGAPNNVAAPAGRPVQKVQEEEQQQQREPGLYQGSAIPSRSFKILQAMTQPENAADNDNSSDIEVPPAMIPQPPFMVPPQYYYDWYDPQNNPWAYYYPGFDPAYFGYAPPSHSRSQTPQPQSQSQSQANTPLPYPPYFYPYPFVILPPFMGFRPISSSRETTPCFSEAERYQMSSSMTDDRNRRAVSCTPTCCQHAKSFPVEDNRNKFNTVEEPIFRPVPLRNGTPPKPPDDEILDEPLKELEKPLRSIPSVDNLNEEPIEELHVHPIVNEDDCRSETSEDTTEVEEEISQDTETVEIHYPHQLSVIYEENESAALERRSSVCSRSSTLSDCSTTLMEDDNISIENQSGDELNEDENSVTVRLPLKFSFTRSKDNMVNTTLTVGESESEVHETTSECDVIRTPSPLFNNRSHPLSNNSSDVSVTFSLKSKSKSKTPERLLNPSLSVKCDNIEESDRECSVSVSLPLKRKSIDERRNSGSHRDDISENSCDNKNNVDASLYTSLDALEEIKKGMLDITNNLFSKICTLRKSALNIPEHERNRSGSVSYIESIESDSENEGSLSHDECKFNDGRRRSSFGIPQINECQEDNNENYNEVNGDDNNRERFWFEDDPDDVNPEHDEHNLKNNYNNNYNEMSQEQNDNSEKYYEDTQEQPYETSLESKKETSHEYSLYPPRRNSHQFNPKELSPIKEYSPFEEPSPAKEIPNEPQNTSASNDQNEEEVDFWSQISNRNQEDHNLSKTSTNSSSKYWFEEDDTDVEPPKEDDGFAKYEINEVTTSISFVSLNEQDINEGENENEEEIDFWADYDPDRDLRSTATKYFESREEVVTPEVNETQSNDCKEDNKSEYDDDSDTESCKDFMNDLKQNSEPKINEELASDEEWTEEEIEVTDDDEPEVIHKSVVKIESPNIESKVELSKVEIKVEPPKPEVHLPKLEIKFDSLKLENKVNYPKIESVKVKPQKAEIIQEDSESEYEEEEEEEESEEEIIEEPKIKPTPQPIVHVKIDNRPCKLIMIKTQHVEIQQPVINQIPQQNSDECSSSEEELSDEEPPPQRSNESSSSRISKGRSLVNVNSFIKSECDRGAMSEMKERLDRQLSSDDDDDEEEEEEEKPLPVSSSINNSHSNDDCHDKVLIHTIDSKSNMTSESGVSFEHNENYSEDGYEEDSEEEIANENEKTITRETPQHDTFEPEINNEIKVNVKSKISMFERAMSEERTIEKQPKEPPRVPSKYSFKFRESSEPPQQQRDETPKNQKLIDLINQRKSLPPTLEIEEKSEVNEKRENYKRFGNSKKSCPIVRSIDESGEEDSGFSCKPVSETETDSENFPELRKLSRYERASTHSRLFKLLQGDEEIPEKDEEIKETATTKIPYKSKKIIHNVSVTRRQNPQVAQQAETMEERRQRLCLPLTHQSSSGAESMSSSTTPSPTPVNEKLVQELVQSLLSQKRGRAFRNLPLEKLHAAAVKILQEDMESNGTLSSADESTVPTVDSTPALTPQEFRNNSSYSEYYESWNNPQSSIVDEITADVIQSKAFRNLQEQQSNANKKLWSVRCPRILSSKSINKDLARVSEVRESESPEPNVHSRSPSIRSLSTEPMSGEKCIVSTKERLANT